MSSSFHHRSIRSKFSLVIISACFAVILLVSLLFAGIEYSSYRQKTAEELETLAAILGVHLTQPLLDHDAILATRVMVALDKNSHLRAAYLFDNKNKPLAQYLDPDAIPFVQKSVAHDFSENFPEEWQQREDHQFHYGLNYLSLYAPIFHQKKMIGGLYLLSDLAGLDQRFFGILLVVLLAGGVAVGFAWLLSGWMQKPISGPILQLAETMHLVSQSGAYHLRSQKYADDEVGQLVDGFNDMLSQIEIRDLKIETHQKYLEETVLERTAELTKTVRDLDLAREQAESANQAKSIFLANITHELRTPLVGVLGMNELLIESSLDSQQRVLAQSVQRSGRELLEMINDILDFSKIEAGHLKLEINTVDLLELVEEIVASFANRAYNKGIELICSVDPAAAWEVEVDAQRLKQIILNLLGNAIKFTHQGHVGFRLTRNNNGHFLFEIYDTGIGVDRQSQSSIFEAFSQVDESTSRLFGGTGLGLSIVRDLTRMMNGSLYLESEPGQGSSFQVELPLKPVCPSFARLAEERQGRTVLLLESYLPARESLLQRLLDLGFAAEAVTSPENLLHCLQNCQKTGKRFELVILPDCEQTGEGLELVSQYADCCERIVCRRKKHTNLTPNLSAIEIQQPLLWTRLLQDDLFQQAPIEPPSPVALDVESPPPPADDSGLRGTILVVDDNTSTRELIGFSLNGSGWLCHEACNAEEALIAVGRQQYRLILMDINMPGTDGFEVTRILRQRGVETPIFALTAHGDARVFDECQRVGMQGSLRKPFRQKELFALLDEYASGAIDKTSGAQEVPE